MASTPRGGADPVSTQAGKSSAAAFWTRSAESVKRGQRHHERRGPGGRGPAPPTRSGGARAAAAARKSHSAEREHGEGREHLREREVRRRGAGSS